MPLSTLMNAANVVRSALNSAFSADKGKDTVGVTVLVLLLMPVSSWW